MTREQVIVVVVALIVGTLAATLTRAATLDEILAAVEACPEAEPCPPLPPMSVCGEDAFVVTLQQWPTTASHMLNPDTVVKLTAGPCGQVLIDNVIHGCLMVSAYNQDGTMMSAVAERNYGGADCQPLPEPSFAVSLALGTAGLLHAARYRRSFRST